MASVTLVIPIRNRAAFLPALFQSLSAVSYEDMEILLVDNGSSDNTLSLCRSFAEDAPIFVTVLEEPQPGASKARNRGLEACRTEWVYFFDSDDEFTPTFLEDIMPQVGEADLVIFPTMQEVGGRIAQRSFVMRSTPSAQMLSSTLNTQGMLFRTRFLRSIGGWNGDLSVWDDWELGIRALCHHPRILWLPRQAYHIIHVHDDSITGPSFSSRREAIQHTLSVVESDSQTYIERRALYLRYCIVNGQMQREGSQSLPVPLSSPWHIRLVGALLQAYTAHGGRGAWRMALMFA